MLFEQYVTDVKPRTYKKLNTYQKRIVTLVSEQNREAIVTFMFEGRKACPYRIVQHLWNDWLTSYPNFYKEKL